MLLTQEEYQYWIYHINTNYFPLPDIIVKDMSDWRKRSTLARALVRIGEYTPAIVLFKSIIGIDVNKEKDFSGLSEIEDKVWCLQELAIILWRTTGNRGEALTYTQKAVTLIATYPQQFNFLDKDEVWCEIQDFIFFLSKEKDNNNRSKIKQ